VKQDLANPPGGWWGMGSTLMLVFNLKYVTMVSFPLVEQSMEHSRGNAGLTQNSSDTGITFIPREISISLILFTKYSSSFSLFVAAGIS
jgi:hypothetical protein